MMDGVYKTLEFNEILDVLGSYTSTPAGKDRVQGLRPSPDRDFVRHTLKETTEGLRALTEGKQVALGETPDVCPHLETLKVEHQSLDERGLLDLATLGRVSDRACSTLKGLHQDFELLRDLGRQIPDLSALRASIEKAISTETGTVKDNASPQLRSIRARIFKLKNRLRSILESYFRQKDSRKILQEQIITERNGRAVLPVRSECRGQLVGIVHGTSSSGATLFIEPLSTVEINNDIVALEEEERQEIARILLGLTDEARSYSTDLATTAELISCLDLIQAKALLSEACNGTEPRIDDGKDLNLESARHPLLLAAIAERAGMPSPAREVVPISLRVNEERSALVLTGPNTGGKTVALKTAGLLSLMAQTGLHVPAGAESSFPVFQRIFADIGDEQSIGSSLSTFSAHLRNIVEMERNLIEPTLVLLDEVGAGTDPAEGGALGTALVDHFRTRGALVLASTHHGMLKSYATTTPGVGSASFQFDPETYEPIYKLVDGSTGRSLAFEMARRLGLPKEIVDRARVLQNEKERKVEDMLQRLEEDSRKMGEDRRQLDQDRRTFEETIRRHKEVAHDIARNREQEKIAFQKKLREEMEQARSEVRTILEEARSRAKQSAQFPATAESVGPEPSLTAVEKDADKQIEHIESRWAPEPQLEARPPLEVHEGERVTISSLGLTGTVVEILGDDVEVTVRDKKLRISTTDLQAVSPAQQSAPGPSPSHTSVPERKFVPQELNVIGCTVDEALSQADKFLDDAFLSDHRTVRLIHGHGKGRLRNAIREWLVKHPHVTKHQIEQSGAVTVVELKE